MAGAVDVGAGKDEADEAAKDKDRDAGWDVEHKEDSPTMAAEARDALHTMAAAAKPSKHNSSANRTPRTQSSATITGTSDTPAASTWKVDTPVPRARTRKYRREDHQEDVHAGNWEAYWAEGYNLSRKGKHDGEGWQ